MKILCACVPGVQTLPKIWETPQNSVCQKGDTKQVPFDPEMLDVNVNYINIISTGSCSFARRNVFTALVIVYYYS
jgi:hypothetical protein